MKDKIVYCPVGSDFAPCDPQELQPIVEHLRANLAVSDQRVFPRGSHLPDGRLDLCKQSIGPIGSELVAEAVKGNNHTKHLLLGANGLGDRGARAVADAVRENGELETIYLGCNRIEEQGAAQLADALQDHQSVTGLWLKRNPIGDEGAERIATLVRRNRTLRTLDLVHTQLGLLGVRRIAEVLSEPNVSIQRLYLGGNRMGPEATKAIADMIAVNRSLRRLYLSVNRIGDEGARMLADALHGNPHLLTLGLSCNDIGPVGAAALVEVLLDHPGLEQLDLGYDRSAPVLEERPNRLSDEGAEAIARLIQRNQTIRSLDLLRNGITTSGARRIVDALEDNRALTRLVIGKGIPRRVKRRVKELLERNAALDERAAERVMDSELEAIRSVYRTPPK